MSEPLGADRPDDPPRRRSVPLNAAGQLPTAGSGMNSRTSCAQRQAAAILAAHARASSREGTSRTVNPVELLGLRIRAGGDRAVAAHHDGIHVLGEPAAEHPHACGHCLADDRMGSLTHGAHLLVGNVAHRAARERDQVPRQLMTPFAAACAGRSSA